MGYWHNIRAKEVSLVLFSYQRRCCCENRMGDLRAGCQGNFGGDALVIPPPCEQRNPAFGEIRARSLAPLEKRVLRNSCRPLKRTRFVPLLLSRHSRAGLSHAATSWLESILSHRSGATSSFVTDSENAGRRDDAGARGRSRPHGAECAS